MLVYSKRMLEIILENIVRTPEGLGLPAAYAESEALLYRQYGRYDTVAVQREGRQLLERAEALQAEYDIAALPRLAKQYAEWSKKLQQLKFQRLLHGEFAAGKGITLYVHAIRQECTEHGWDYAAYYDSVLVHERVHLLHYQAVLAHFGAAGAAVQSAEHKQAQRYWYGRQTEAAQAAVVKETLAEFARWLWCLQQGHLALAQARLQTPEEAQACIPYYPYAGVRGLCALHASSLKDTVRTYSELWQLSLTSWQQAYARIKELNAVKQSLQNQEHPSNGRFDDGL